MAREYNRDARGRFTKPGAGTTDTATILQRLATIERKLDTLAIDTKRGQQSQSDIGSLLAQFFTQYRTDTKETKRDREQRDRKLGNLITHSKWEAVKFDLVLCGSCLAVTILVSSIAHTSRWCNSLPWFAKSFVPFCGILQAIPTSTTTTAVSTTGTPQTTRLRQAIFGQESGDPNAVNASGSGAIGASQIMPENVGPWSEQCLGSQMSPDELRGNLEAQIAITDCKLAEYWETAISKAGGDESIAVRMVASMWYSGSMDLYDDSKPQSWAGDSYPSIRDYTLAVLDRYNAIPAEAPAVIEVANVTTNAVAAPAVDTNAIVAKAREWVGKDYNPGVEAQCAYFVREVLSSIGIDVGVTSKAIDGHGSGAGLANSFFGEDIGQLITDKSQLQPGDLIAFYNTYGNWTEGTITHVGIYVGNGQMVDRSTKSAPVKERSIDTFTFAAGVRLSGVPNATPVTATTQQSPGFDPNQSVLSALMSYFRGGGSVPTGSIAAVSVSSVSAGGAKSATFRMGSATGWMATDGYAYTATHVIDAYQQGMFSEATTQSGESCKFEVVESKGDLTKMTITGACASLPGIPLGTHEDGEAMKAYGFPQGGSMYEAVGKSGGTSQDAMGRSSIEFKPDSLPGLQAGMSGGPCIGSDGAAIGVVSNGTNPTGQMGQGDRAWCAPIGGN